MFCDLLLDFIDNNVLNHIEKNISIISNRLHLKTSETKDKQQICHSGKLAGGKFIRDLTFGIGASSFG